MPESKVRRAESAGREAVINVSRRKFSQDLPVELC